MFFMLTIVPQHIAQRKRRSGSQLEKIKTNYGCWSNSSESQRIAMKSLEKHFDVHL